jgi:NADPH-dependent 2,4-dienoyl-CoA reductase/sulfur reductase-like enzyme
MPSSVEPAPVVIVGGAMGGLRTAESLRKAGYAGPIRVLGDELHAPYNRPPLSKDVLEAGVTHDAVAFPSRAETADVEWMLGARATAVDLAARTVTTSDGATHPYAALVIATGLRPRRLPFRPDSAGPPRHAIRTLDDALALRAQLVPGARVVVAGSGFLGCELASTASKLGCSATVVTTSAEPMVRPLGMLVAAELRRRLQAEGVTFELATTIAAVMPGQAGERGGVELASGRMLPADLVIEAIGSDCNIEWLADSGLDLSDGVLADNALRAIDLEGTVHPEVMVVGDIARFPNPMFDDVPRRIEHWNIPTDTGRRAGAVLAAHLAGDESVAATEFAPMPSFWSNQFEMKLQAYGLPGLGDEDDVRILLGDLSGDCAVGYYRDDRLVGVVGIGMKAALLPYRQEILEHARG